jgi:hypothetical protein
VRADIAFQAVLVELVVLERLSTMEVSIAVSAAEALDVAVGEQVTFKFIGSRELAHAAEVATEGALEPLRQVVDEHVPAQAVFPLESRGAVLRNGQSRPAQYFKNASLSHDKYINPSYRTFAFR